ncbi:MAG: hypothetical protein ACXVRJ_08765 [Gaiellaceae bacterium]
MKRAAVLLVAAAVLLGAALHPHRAAATLPSFPSGSSVGEGVPFKAYATIAPQVHLFGDVITARLAVVADTKWVDLARLRVSTGFTPYTLVRHSATATVRVGRFQQLTWTWTLRCITTACVPRVPPSERFHIYRFQLIHVDYLAANGTRAYGINATWPKVEVVSQVSPGVAKFLQRTQHLNWRFHLAPVASPTYRVSPSVLFWLALCAGMAMLLGAFVLAWRWYRLIRPRRLQETGGSTATPLERALAVLAWAHARGDETLERKAFERVAGELDVEAPVPEVDELSRTARELAWSSHTPEDQEVETFSERARETRRPPETEQAAE